MSVAPHYCRTKTCLRVAARGSSYCEECCREVMNGQPCCSTLGCPNVVFSNGLCAECLIEIGERLGNIPFPGGSVDPRIAKLEAIANDPAASDSEKNSARNLIDKLKSKAVPGC